MATTIQIDFPVRYSDKVVKHVCKHYDCNPQIAQVKPGKLSVTYDVSTDNPLNFFLLGRDGLQIMEAEMRKINSNKGMEYFLPQNAFQ